MLRSEIQQHFVDREIVPALVRNGLPYDHPMRATLDAEAVIVGRNACVRVVDDCGGWIMLDERVKQLKADPRFRDSVPNPAKIARGDESGLRDKFDEIAKGTAVVE